MGIGKKNNRALSALLKLLLPLAAVAALLLFTVSVNSLGSGHSAEEMQQLEIALRRSCVTCYAVEGVYPPNVEYLEQHYGIQIDRARYTVYYDVFAENLMPDITVMENEL